MNIELRIKNKKSNESANKNNDDKLAKVSNAKKTIKISRHIYLMNADDQKIGRIATIISKYLRGKNKPIFEYNKDCGDVVIVINSSKIKINAKKAKAKKFYRHSGYVKGLKEQSMADIFKIDPGKLIFMAVKGMMPINKISRAQLKRLKIYKDDQHKHKAQQITEININEEK